jgi:hypothetical protein
MANRPSVERAAAILIRAMRETAEDDDLETFVKVLRAWDVPAGDPSEATCLQAWHEKRDEIAQRRRAAPRGSSR